MSDLIKWIEPCLQPLDPEPCGQDPRYLDEFEQIKVEIEKLSGCDYSTVLELSHKLLSKESKDLRVAGFLCLALVQQYQIPGLLAGLHLYTEFLQQFAKALHPRSSRARASAISWLNTPRIPALLSDVPIENQAQQDVIMNAIAYLNGCINQHLGDGYPLFHGLDEWLVTQSVATTESGATVEKTENTETSPIETTELPSEKQLIEIQDDKDAAKLQRHVIEYYRHEKQWLQACQLARAWRWGDLTLPPDQSNQTTLPAPRKEAQQSLEKMSISNEPEIMLDFCETLFMEPAGLFHLDLQLYAYQAALSMQEGVLADYLRQHTSWLCQKYPRLKTLSFANGMPFVSQVTKHWLSEADEIPQTKQDVPSAHNILQTIIDRLSEKTLALVLEQLECYPAQNGLDSLHVMQAKAQACAYFRDADLALIFYKSLLEKIEQTHFATWLPEEAMSIWREVMNFIKGVGSKSIPMQQRQTLQADLLKKMYLLNSHQACTWFHDAR